MRIAIGSDHREYGVLRQLLAALQKSGHEIEDFGCDSMLVADYPDIARPVALAVADNECHLGILLDRSGMGMCMAANKVHGIRAAVVHDEFSARCAREQHHCNIICLAADLIGERYIQGILDQFLSAGPAAGRHARRVEKLMRIEQLRQPRLDADSDRANVLAGCYWSPAETGSLSLVARA